MTAGRSSGHPLSKVTDNVTQQPSVAGRDTAHHIKAIGVPYHLIYGSLICVKRLQRDRQNKKGYLQTPGGHQNMTIKYLSVGLWC